VAILFPKLFQLHKQNARFLASQNPKILLNIDLLVLQHGMLLPVLPYLNFLTFFRMHTSVKYYFNKTLLQQDDAVTGKSIEDISHQIA
jgi:hypothetical protein